MPVRNVYLKIEAVHDYSPVQPGSHGEEGRDCMRNPGHEDGAIPPDEARARRLDALIYREYLDHHWLVPKPDKIVWADVNEPPFLHRVPGAVIYAKPGERLRIHVKNADSVPHSFHLHGLAHGIDSDGAWPFGTQSRDGRRSDEICSGQTWTYTFDVHDHMLGAWPFHDHYRDFVRSVERGLFGGVIVVPARDYEAVPTFPLPPRLVELLKELEHHGKAAASLTMAGGGGGVHDLPRELREQVLLLEELMHAPQRHLVPKPPHPLHVPIFLHRLSGTRRRPLFQSADVAPDEEYTSPAFALPAVYNYHCGVHGDSTSGRISVKRGASSLGFVEILGAGFTPADVEVGIGGKVLWVNPSDKVHRIVESGGDSMPSRCFNGRCFAGNTPTIAADSGQRILWHFFNLDFGEAGHSFHPHGQRWRFAGETVDVRSLGPAESFAAETKAPPVLVLPTEIESYQDAKDRPRDARLFRLRGDFLFHSTAEHNLREGMAGLVRAEQTVWLTPEDAARVEAQTGLPLDRGDNDCPAIDLDRCASSMVGKWEKVDCVAGVSMMHAVLLPDSRRVLFWGYLQDTCPRLEEDHSRLWDLGSGLYSPSALRPQDVTSDENIWSGAHAHLGDGKVLVHGGYVYKYREEGGGREPVPPLSVDTERRSFFFDPRSLAWSKGPDTQARRFYPTTITLADGRLLTLYGTDTLSGNTIHSLEVFDPRSPSAWRDLKALPPAFGYKYYPWTFLLPDGKLFIAGPEQPSRRFAWEKGPIMAEEWSFTIGQARGENMNGTAVLLPLEPPYKKVRVLVAGGASVAAKSTAEWIELGDSSPGWRRLPDLKVARNNVSSVLLPDGRVFLAGGTGVDPGGGPVELFDPEDPEAGWQLGPAMAIRRRYHSAAILLPDGSVLMGGDTTEKDVVLSKDGENLPHERYLPSYFFKPRPEITSAPAVVPYGAGFTVKTPRPKAIRKVVLMRPGAVTHGFDMSQRSVVCDFKVDKDSIEATPPPHGNVAPPGCYLLFLVDLDRVPSTGTWMRLE